MCFRLVRWLVSPLHCREVHDASQTGHRITLVHLWWRDVICVYDHIMFKVVKLFTIFLMIVVWRCLDCDWFMISCDPMVALPWQDWELKKDSLALYWLPNGSKIRKRYKSRVCWVSAAFEPWLTYYEAFLPIANGEKVWIEWLFLET